MGSPLRESASADSPEFELDPFESLPLAARETFASRWGAAPPPPWQEVFRVRSGDGANTAFDRECERFRQSGRAVTLGFAEVRDPDLKVALAAALARGARPSGFAFPKSCVWRAGKAAPPDEHFGRHGPWLAALHAALGAYAGGKIAVRDIVESEDLVPFSGVGAQVDHPPGGEAPGPSAVALVAVDRRRLFLARVDERTAPDPGAGFLPALWRADSAPPATFAGFGESPAGSAGSDRAPGVAIKPGGDWSLQVAAPAECPLYSTWRAGEFGRVREIKFTPFFGDHFRHAALDLASGGGPSAGASSPPPARQPSVVVLSRGCLSRIRLADQKFTECASDPDWEGPIFCSRPGGAPRRPPAAGAGSLYFVFGRKRLWVLGEDFAEVCSAPWAGAAPGVRLTAFAVAGGRLFAADDTLSEVFEVSLRDNRPAE